MSGISKFGISGFEICFAPPNKSFETDARLRASHALLFLSCWMPFASAGQFQRSAAHLQNRER